MRPPRKRAKAIAQGRGRDHRVVIPFAFELAARISARPLDAFRNDPTQLANALSELHQATGADGIVCAAASEMELHSAGGQGLDIEQAFANGPLAASLEACRRIRATVGDDAALLAGVTGPATLARQFSTSLDAGVEAFGAVVKQFCDAGSDVVVVFEDESAALDEAWRAGLKTADNIARFHQVALLLWSGDGLPSPHKVPLDAPAPDGLGIITTDRQVPADADIAALERWVAVVKETQP
ncbi:MAG TPA: hypothetical protein QF901_07515 [Gammaproteobacteria bacterium]|nr:hypothetical protein [Gammaproteobacteria bacterium]